MNKQEKISEAIAKVLGVDFEDMKERISQRRVNYARDMFCYFLRNQSDATLEETGLLLGGRKRPTVYRSVNNITGMCNVYDWVKEDINNIKSELNDY